MSKPTGTTQEPGDIGYNGFLISLFYLARIDIEVLSDPHLLVIFKNLLKKNSVTREKRLGELFVLIQEGKIDYRSENFVMVWLQLYPRIALDSSKTVRQISHQIQATILANFDIRVFKKYFKSCIPVMLQALYDEKAVASTSFNALLLTFSHDAQRVNETLWIAFHEQIANYCKALIVNESATLVTDERYETSDDVVMKYDRAVNGGIQMVVKLVNLANKGDFFLSESAMADLGEVLHCEKFWDRLDCSHGANINVVLLKSYMQLVKVVFSLDEGKLCAFTSHVDDVKGLYKLVSKKIVKNVKLQPPNSESANASIVYSSAILQIWDSLTALTQFTGLEETERKNLKIKKNFWQLGGSKSYSRLREYLKLGSCQSDPVYYLILKSFFAALKSANIDGEDDFLDFTSAKDAKFIFEKILLSQLVLFKGFKAVQFKSTCAECILVVYSLFEVEDETLTRKIVWAVVDAFASARPNEEKTLDFAMQQLKDFISSQSVDIDSLSQDLLNTFGQEFKADSHEFASTKLHVFTVFAHLLAIYGKVEAFLDEIVEKSAELYEPRELADAFSALNSILKVSKPTKSFEEFALTIPSFLSPEFVDLPLQLFDVLIEKKAKINIVEITEDMFTKLSADSPERLKDLFLLLDRRHAVDFQTLESSSPEIHEYLVSLSKKVNRSQDEDQIVFAFLHHSQMIQNVLSSDLDEDLQLKVIEQIAQSGSSVDLGEACGILLGTALRNIEKSFSQEFVKLQDKDVVKDIIFTHIIETSNHKDISNFLTANTEFLPIEAITQKIHKSINTVDLSQVALANPLVQNIHMVQFPAAETCELNSQVIPIASFLVDYNNTSTPEILLLVGLCGQYLQDYAFIMNSETPKDQVLNYESSLTKSFIENSRYEGDVAAVVNGTLDEQHVAVSLASSITGNAPYTPEQFYHGRLLEMILSPVFESMSLKEFENLDIKYTKLGSSPLKLAVFLCSAVKFLSVSKKLDRVRQYVFGEVLGVKSHQIMEKGTIWISLATNFLRIDDEYSGLFEVMPVHKWGMFINQIQSWLESDIAYDNEFLPMRCLLAVFFTYLIPAVRSLPDKTWEIAVDLCLNNLSTAQVEYSDVELKYFSMRLFVVLRKHVNEDKFELWPESRASIVEELVDLMVNEEIETHSLARNNTPIFLANELMERILTRENVPRGVVEDKSEKFYTLLTSSKFLNLQRTAVVFLEKFILETQQDLVIEYSLQKSNLGDSSENVSQTLELPKQLVENISGHISEFLEAAEEKQSSLCFKYLWSWILVFDHFKDTTYAMKTDYINQLKKSGAIDNLFTTIVSLVDVSDSKFVAKLVAHPLNKQEKARPINCLIQDYEVKDGCVGEDLDFEVQFVLVHLYYLSFQYLGSFVQKWFNEIRDLQLKNSMERFSVRYVSPILIFRMLDEVEKQKSKLTLRDANLTIKVNTVTNEIKSVYLIDEQTMEMVVKIPETFPLSNVSVEGPVRLGVKETQWKAWLLASQRVISLTNGSITDAIDLFNRNVNLHFSGFEECAICYSILHQDHSLPLKVCPTCLNKFHAACLYKWFKSSGSSTCPLCRCAFNFKVNRG